MRTTTKITLTAFTMLALLAPSGGAVGSAANPFPHTFVGYSAAYGDLPGLDASAAIVGVCADVSPVLTLDPLAVLPGDSVPEVGAGGACFPYKTTYGDDTGTTQRVHVQADFPVGLSTLFLVCIDVNWDGLCTDPADTPGAGHDDVVKLCIAPNGNGGDLFPDGGPCSIQLTSHAVKPFLPTPAVWVLILPGAVADNGQIVASSGIAGSIYYD